MQDHLLEIITKLAYCEGQIAKLTAKLARHESVIATIHGELSALATRKDHAISQLRYLLTENRDDLLIEERDAR